jgi:ABC-type transport system involved in multi-copper enzyme maturation permease subunit
VTWNVWTRQAFAIAKAELQRYFLARRWLGVYFIAAAPVFLLLVAALQPRRGPSIVQASAIYSVFFQTFWLRLAVFFSCMTVFSQMFRGEMLEKTLHFYLLTPVRREVIAVGKYLAGLISMGALFSIGTILTNILIYVRNPGYSDFLLQGDGGGQLVRYVLATVLACATYGGIFLILGLRFRNPIIPSVILLAWETFYFVLPATVQKFTVMHYIQSFLPAIDLGPFAVVVDPTSPVIGVPLLAGVAVLLVWMSGNLLKKTEISYSTD